MLKTIRTALWIGGALIAAFAVTWLMYMPDRTERGVWRAQAGGMVLSLGPLQAKVFAQTSYSCGLLYAFPAHLKLVELTEGARIAVQGDTLTLTVDGSLDPMIFARIADVPDPCQTPLPATPRSVFDAMWTAMNEHYAFFGLYGVNWQDRAALAPAPDAEMTDEALLALLGKALDGLDDGHIQIAAPFAYFTPKQRPYWLTEDSGLDRQKLAEIARQNLGVPLEQMGGTALEVATLPDGIVYVMIRSMQVDQALGQSGFDAAATAFAQIAPMLRDASGIILDVRYNPGGSDDIALGFASHFTGTDVPIFTKTSRIGTAQSAPFTATLPAYDNTPLETPVIVLTSDLTASAAEIFTLAIRSLPQVTVMGEPTSGGLSDIAAFVLPNGWQLGLSNQTYLTMDGTLYEGIGIPPDVTLTFDTAAFAAGDDPVLAAAITQFALQ